MKSIHTLVPDIYTLFSSRERIDADTISNLSGSVSSRLTRQLGHERLTERSGLRLSQMGPRCPRALWYSIHHPELREALPPWAEIKYLYGHILEALLIELCKAAGHEVVGEQDEVVLDGVVGHRDCVIDGCVVDIKSSSSRGFIKFKDKTIAQDDSFGYLDQLDGYTVASRDDSLVTVKDKAYLLAIDKQLGHLCLYEHAIRDDSIRGRIKYYKQIVSLVRPPPCNCGTVSEGKSGNQKLDVKASYSAYKHCCFPNLRTFLYAGGPVYLTKIVRKPEVPEIDKQGNLVYN